MSNVINMPNAKQVSFGGLNLHLRLDGRSILKIEQRLKKSLMGLFISGDGGFTMPPTGELLVVIQGANQTSGITDKAIIEAFEKHLDEGNSVLDVQTIVQELLDESGFFGNKKEVTEISGELEPSEMTLDSVTEVPTEDSLV